MSGSVRRKGRTPGGLGDANPSRDAVTRADVWRAIVLLPNPLPAFSRETVDISTRFLGQVFNAPVVLRAGASLSAQPSALQELAAAANRLNLPLFTGDIGAVLDSPTRLEDMRSMLDAAGAPARLAEFRASAMIRLFGDLPAGFDRLRAALDTLEADALAIQLDFTEPAPVDLADPTGTLDVLAEAVSSLHLPLLISAQKGIPRWTARALVEHGISGLITGGVQAEGGAMGDIFADWGIPAHASIRMLRGMGVPVISDGQVWNGMDASKAIALGADLVAPSPSAMRRTATNPDSSVDAAGLDAWLDRFLAELRTTMYLAGARNLAALKQSPFVATGETREWLEAAEMMWRNDSGHN